MVISSFKRPLTSFTGNWIEKLVVALIFFGALVSTLSSLYLSGWSGGKGAQLTTLFSVGLFLVFNIYFFFALRISINFSNAFKFFAILAPALAIIILLAIRKRDSSFVVGFLVFISILGVGKFVTDTLAPSSKSKYLAYLPVGQLSVVAIFLTLQYVVPLGLLSLLIVCVGSFLAISEVKRLKNFLNNQIIKSGDLNQNGAFIQVFCSITIILLITAHAPVLGYDSLSMKMWIPKIWASSDTIFLPTEHLLSGVTGSFSFPLLMANELGGSLSGNTLQLLSLLFSAFVLLKSFKRKSKRFSMIQKLSILLLISVPANIWQLSNSYDDLWLTAILFSGVAFAQQNFESLNLREAFFIGLVVGSVVTAKFSLMPVTLILILFLGIFHLYKSEVKTKFAILQITGILIGFLLSLIPFYGWKWMMYANPVWPLFNNIFKAPGAPHEYIKFNLPYSSLSLGDFLLAPITTLINTPKWGEEGAPGAYSTMYSLILVGTIISFFVFRKSNKKIMHLVNVIFLINWIVNFRYSRYLLQILPVALVVLTSSIETSREKKASLKLRRSNMISTVSIFLVGIMFTASFTIGNPASPQRIPYRHIFSSSSNDFYLNYTSSSYRLINDLNTSLPKSAIIVSPQIYERVWLRSDLTLYHFWEASPEILAKAWRVFLTEPNTYPEQYYRCNNSIIFEFYTISPPSCTKKVR